MEVGDKIQIGKYECNVSGTYGDYYLGVPEVDNNNIYDQFNISREDLFKNSAGLGSFTDYGKFPYHKSLSDLDKTIAYIKSYDTKHLIGSKNHPEYSNLKGRQVKFLKNLRKYNVGDFGTIISENDNYPDALLQLCDKHSVNRSRFRSSCRSRKRE